MEGKIQNFDEMQIESFILSTAEKFVGKFGIARLGIDVQKVDLFSGKATIKLDEP